MTYKSIGIFPLFFFVFLRAQEPEPLILEVDFPFSQKQAMEKLETVPHSMHIASYVLHADVPIHEREMASLFNIKKNYFLSHEDLLNGLKYVDYKNRFQRVVFTFKKQTVGYQVDVEFVGHWTFYQVKIHGFLLNKDRFGSYYLLEPGQKFELEKHQGSIERIKNIFKEDGYFNADIREQLIFDEKLKTVTVHLTIDRGPLFIIDGVEINAEGATGISEIEVRDLKKKLTARLKGSLAGNYYSKTLIDQEIKELKAYLRKKGYLRSGLKVVEKVQRGARNVVLMFSLTVHKKKKFVFLGNHFFSSDQMLEKVSLFAKAASHIPSAIIVAEIEDAYKKHGFLSVKIYAEEEDDKFVFVISEGPRGYINRFNLQGNDSFSMPELERLVLHDFSKYFIESDVQRKIEEALLAFYRQRGFWDCAVSVSFLRDSLDDAWIAKIKIHEGLQRFLGTVSIPDFKELEGLKPFNRGAFSAEVVPFNNSIIEEQRQFLTQYLQKQGCLYAHVKPEFAQNDKNFDITWRVVGDTRAVAFGKTVVVGNSSLPYEKIIRELVYREGMAWDRNKIGKSLENLRKLSIFESVSLYPLNSERGSDTKSLVLQVVDSSPFEARVRIGYQHVNIVRGSTYKIGGSMLLKNPTNSADLVRFDADMTRFYRSVSLNYELPWILNQPIKTIIRGYLETYDQPLFWGTREFLYRADHDGFCVRFLKGLSFGDVGLAVGCDWLSTRDLSPGLAHAINFEPQLIGKKFGFIFFEPHFLIDLLDNNLNPTWGALTNISFRGALGFTDAELSFAKALFEQSFFFPVSRETIGAIRCRFGHIFHGNFSTLIPPERFYLGGPHSLRGYEPNMAPPLGKFELNDILYVPVGGKTMFNMNLELRIPIRGNLGGVIFQDIGALVAGKIPHVSSEDVSTASGFGARYATPIGPVRFDLGIKWKKRFEQDSRIAWFLTFGHAF